MRRKTRNPVTNQKCPLCDRYDYVGDQGYSRFFCRDCYIEFRKYTKINREKKVVEELVDIYDIGENGSNVYIGTEVMNTTPIEEDK